MRPRGEHGEKKPARSQEPLIKGIEDTQ
jgi:hypothetical protein